MAEFWKDIEDIKSLIKAVSEAKVDFEWEKDDGCKIVIKASEKETSVSTAVPVSVQAITPSVHVPVQPVDYIPMTSQASVLQTYEEQETAKNNEEGFQIVTSPLVGTFYSAASPDDEPFVKTGDRVSKGQKLGIIEAMKLMNDIESDYDGEIVEVMISNESMVEYGQPLFKIKA